MRLDIMTRAAAWRLGALFVGLGSLGAWGYLAFIRMPGSSHVGPLPPLDADGEALADTLRADVRMLTVEIGERALHRRQGLRTAAERLRSMLGAAGASSSLQGYPVEDATAQNVEASVYGSDRAADIVVVGAHYDAVPLTTGADDNASGVAALVALTRRFAHRHPRATLRFVAFANEEQPYFQTDAMGSLVYARRCKTRGEHVIAMLSLESIGFYSDAKGSQKYPAPLSLIYPSTGSFIGFVSDRSSAELVRRAIGTFRRSTPFPSEGAALFASTPGVGWSDQWAFWQMGYPAIMITDTAPFRYPHYHKADDTPDKLDYARMARVVVGIDHVIADLVGVE